MIKPRADVVLLLVSIFIGMLIAFGAFQSGRLYQYVTDITYPIQTVEQ